MCLMGIKRHVGGGRMKCDPCGWNSHIGDDFGVQLRTEDAISRLPKSRSGSDYGRVYVESERSGDGARRSQMRLSTVGRGVI